MGVILEPLLQVVLIVLDLYMWVILISVVLSWLVAFNVINTYNRFVHILGDVVHRLTEPLLAPVRRVLPNFGGMDLSPMVLILGVIFLQGVIKNLLFSLG